jgi:hypothetical protein
MACIFLGITSACAPYSAGSAAPDSSESLPSEQPNVAAPAADCLDEKKLAANGLAVEPLSIPFAAVTEEDVAVMVAGRHGDLDLSVDEMLFGNVAAPEFPLADKRTLWLVSVVGMPPLFSGGLESPRNVAGPYCTVWAFDAITGEYVFGMQTEIGN